jgi:hypothetical protein
VRNNRTSTTRQIRNRNPPRPSSHKHP